MKQNDHTVKTNECADDAQKGRVALSVKKFCAMISDNGHTTAGFYIHDTQVNFVVCNNNMFFYAVHIPDDFVMKMPTKKLDEKSCRRIVKTTLSSKPFDSMFPDASEKFNYMYVSSHALCYKTDSITDVYAVTHIDAFHEKDATTENAENNVSDTTDSSKLFVKILAPNTKLNFASVSGKDLSKLKSILESPLDTDTDTDNFNDATSGLVTLREGFVYPVISVDVFFDMLFNDNPGAFDKFLAKEASSIFNGEYETKFKIINDTAEDIVSLPRRIKELIERNKSDESVLYDQIIRMNIYLKQQRNKPASTKIPDILKLIEEGQIEILKIRNKNLKLVSMLQFMSDEAKNI
jgi:hypothetical protein